MPKLGAGARLGAMVLVSTVFAFVFAEIGLALAGVRPQWTYATDWIQDDLFCRYTLKPGSYPNLFGTAARINRLGARGAEPGHTVALLLGDSCTFGVNVPEDRSTRW